MPRSAVDQLSELEVAAWRGFLRVHSMLLRELDRELESTHGLPLTDFEVLVRLDNAPGKRMRMSELASSVLLSQSGITRLVDRLDGLVAREPCPGDRRGLHARITEEGSRRLAEALPTHLAGVRKRFLSRLDEDEQHALAAAWEHIRPGITI
jgi:DNA-binding MarR family transcriptional regulator